MSVGEELMEERRRRRRRAGDPRLTDADREIFRRITTGDLAAEFQAALDAVSDADRLLGGGHLKHEWPTSKRSTTPPSSTPGSPA